MEANSKHYEAGGYVRVPLILRLIWEHDANTLGFFTGIHTFELRQVERERISAPPSGEVCRMQGGGEWKGQRLDGMVSLGRVCTQHAIRSDVGER